MVECCKSNTVRKPWEALITRLPRPGPVGYLLATMPSPGSTCVLNKQGFPTGPAELGLELGTATRLFFI